MADHLPAHAERERNMTDPINSYARRVQSDPTLRAAIGQVGRQSSDSASRTSQEPVGRTTSDEVALSNVAQRVMAQPDFDRAKVDAIKQAIQNGQYPLNSRKIAESFVAIEQMIKE
jgi:flagellar biosynthesis anti-sigma factor FlgM